MEVSPKTFREVEFREKMRGYHPEDVDQFLEQMATAVEAINERLRQADERVRQADERVQRAEATAAESGGSDDALRRTLVLAQRTADLAVSEAREEAVRIVATAEQQAQGIVSEAEERARRLHGEALADVHAELAKLEATRAQAQQEVETLNRWATEHRAHLSDALKEALAAVDGAGVLAPPPSSSPIVVPSAPRALGQSSAVALPPGPEPSPASERPAPEARNTPEARSTPEPRGSSEGRSSSELRTRERGPADAGSATQTVPAVVKAGGGGDVTDTAVDDELKPPDEDSLDNLFEDGEFDNGPRFGGRLRRRH